MFNDLIKKNKLKYLYWWVERPEERLIQKSINKVRKKSLLFLKKEAIRGNLGWFDYLIKRQLDQIGRQDGYFDISLNN